MPLGQEEFEKDFLPPHALEPDSLERFRGLLKRRRELCISYPITAFTLGHRFLVIVLLLSGRHLSTWRRSQRTLAL
jgi:hypothetical protein